MKPLLIALAVALGLGAIASFVYYARLARYDPSIRSMVANEERQGRFLIAGLVLLAGAAAAVWFA